MPITATSHAALAAEDARAALSRCASVQSWLGITSGTAGERAMAALALIFLQDAGELLPARYLLVTVRPQPPVREADDTLHRVFDVEVQCVTDQPDDADTAQEDFLHALNLDEVGKEWMDQHEDGLLDFELVAVPHAAEGLRDDDLSDRAADLLQLINAQLECWGD